VEARKLFIVRQPALDPERLIFLDETAIMTNMGRTHGRCIQGMRLVEPIPHGHRMTSTFVAGLRTCGITAPYVVSGAMNGPMFLAYIEQMLAPTIVAGETLIMDNVAFHKVSGIREAIEKRGANLLYLPAYSPDLNPIEKAFAKLKALLRKAAARTKETLWKAVGEIIALISRNDCRSFFECCGYAT